MLERTKRIFFFTISALIAGSCLAKNVSQQAVCEEPFHGYGCATIGFAQPRDEQELFDSNCVYGFVIFHYGRDMKDMGIWADQATRAGVPTLAIPSVDLHSRVNIIVNGLKLKESYSQQEFERIIPSYVKQKLRGRLHGQLADCSLYDA